MKNLKRPKNSKPSSTKKIASKKDSGSNIFQSCHNSDNTSDSPSKGDGKQSPEFGMSQVSSKEDLNKFIKRSSTMGTNQFEKFQIKVVNFISYE